jgi:hypothetical protein
VLFTGDLTDRRIAVVFGLVLDEVPLLKQQMKQMLVLLVQKSLRPKQVLDLFAL